MPKADSFQIQTKDGVEIGATLYSKQERSKHIIVIGPATGAPQYYYKNFAAYASENSGFDALTFDFRGVGTSLREPIAQSKATMVEWGEQDLSAILHWANEHYSKVFVLGHSITGQILPLADGSDGVSASFFVASQSAYIGHWSGWSRFQTFLFWRLLIPLTTAIYGFMPGWAMLGKVSLPKGVAREWRKFGLHRNGAIMDYKHRAEKYFKIKYPVHFMSLADDKLFAPSGAVQALMRQYLNAKATFQFVRPEDMGVKEIGHFGFFKKQNQAKLWSLPIMYFTQFTEDLE